jgi:hypothetical protein
LGFGFTTGEKDRVRERRGAAGVFGSHFELVLHAILETLSFPLNESSECQVSPSCCISLGIVDFVLLDV